MKNREVFKIIAQHIEPLLVERGFAPARDPANRPNTGWSRPFDSRHFNLWCQCGKSSFDPFTGSRFTIELELSPQPVPGVSAFDQRARFARLLDAADLRSMLDVHNEIVSKFRMPSDEEYEQVMGFPQMDAAHTFAAKFARRDRPIGNEDFWMQYRDKEDVTLWADFIRHRLAKAISRFEARITGQSAD